MKTIDNTVLNLVQKIADGIPPKDINEKVHRILESELDNDHERVLFLRGFLDKVEASCSDKWAWWDVQVQYAKTLTTATKKLGELRNELDYAENSAPKDTDSNIPEYITKAIHLVAHDKSRHPRAHDCQTIYDALTLYYSTDLYGKDVAKKYDIPPNTFSTWKKAVDKKLG
ncbi:MAG TPA: hypothetical protein VJ964_09020 [Balneolaceae bacterium]|nr:hypothetical protein [Balneolaceae bacterium]